MSKDLKLALNIAAKTTGRDDLAELAKTVARLGDETGQAAPEAQQLAKDLEQLARQDQLITRFQQSSRQLEQHTAATAAAASQLDLLKKSAEQADRPMAELTRDIDQAERELGQMRQALAKQSAGHRRLQGALQKTGVDSRRLTAEQIRVKQGLNQAAHEAERLGRSYAQANGLQQTFGNGVRNLTTRLTALAGAYFGINALTRQIRQMLATGDQFERLYIQLNQVMGSIEDGRQASAWIREFTQDTPLRLEQVSQAFVRLKAFGLDPMDGTLQAIVDQAFKLGGSFEEVQGISLALGQAWAKQKLQGEEILQLIERGVPVWDLLANVTGKNTLELQKLSAQGELGRDVLKALMEEIGRQSRGAAAEGMQTLSGLVSNAQDNLVRFYNMVAQSGALDWLKEQLATLNAEFKRMAADGRLQQWAQKISDALVAQGEGIKRLIGLLYQWRAAIGVAVKAWTAMKLLQWAGEVTTLASALRTRLIAQTLAAGAAFTATGNKARGMMGILAGIPKLGWGGLIAGGILLGEVLYDTARAAGEYAARLGKAAEIERQVAEARIGYYSRLASQGETAMAQFARYKDLVILTAEQVAKLTEQERRAYDVKLRGHQQYLAGQLTVRKALEANGLAVEAAAYKNEQGLARMRDGFTALKQGMVLVQQGMQLGLSPAVAQLLGQFATLTGEGKNSQQALAALFKTLDVGAHESVANLLETLVALQEQGTITAEELNSYLGGALDQLSTEELARFRVAAETAFAGAQDKAVQLGLAVASVTGAALKKLGLDVEELKPASTRPPAR